MLESLNETAELVVEPVHYDAVDNNMTDDAPELPWPPYGTKVYYMPIEPCAYLAAGLNSSGDSQIPIEI